MSSISLELPENIEELRDVSNSEAYKIIDTLLDDLVVSPERGDTAKSRYAKLHAALFAAMSREKELLSQAKQLKRKLEEDERTAKIGLASGGGVEATIDTLREDVESAMAEAALAQERQQLLQLEVTDLQRQRNDLSKRGQEVAVEHAAALAPLIDTLRSDITVLRVDNETERERVSQTQEHLQAAKAKVVTTNSEIDALALVKSQERLALTKVEQLPDKAKRQVETVSGVLKNLQASCCPTSAPFITLHVSMSQMEAANAKLQELEAAFRAVRAKEQELQNEHAKLLNGLDRARVQVQTKDRHADDIRKDLELASIEADKILADQVDLDMRIKAAAAQAKMESEVLTRKVREKELGLRQIKAAEAALIEAQDALPNLRFQASRQRHHCAGKAHHNHRNCYELHDCHWHHVSPSGTLSVLHATAVAINCSPTHLCGKDGRAREVEQLQRDRATLEAHAKMQHNALEEVRRDLDISMNDFLKEEAVGKDKASVFQVTLKQVGLMMEELLALRKEEAERTKILMELGSQRDRVALAIAQKLAKVKEVQLTTRIKEVELAELKKIRRETNRRIRDFEKLYDLVKNQRNKFVNLIQACVTASEGHAANQATTEMKDKSKILHNEQDILHNEVNVKDRLLNQSRNQHGIAVTERDALRIELGKYGATFRDKQDRVDEQIADVDKLNAIINLTEKDMLKLRKQYETVIEARNYTGIMLIDRNDELCILYEKANIQEEVLKSGDLELRHKDDEIRILRLEVASLERSIAVAIKVVPQIPALDEDVARLQKARARPLLPALLEARRESEALSLALENPSNQARWRLLEGKIPDKEELSAKLQQLEERLNDRKEALLEKELILEEVTQLSDKLREQASEGRADTLELAQKVNEYQGRLRAVTRRIMATVSELSMYQATSLKLGAEKEGLEGAVQEARQRLEQGLPPTEDAEREWQRRLREASTLQELASTRAEEAHILEAKGTEVDSAAEPRPNAYIPEDLGIPKPYALNMQRIGESRWRPLELCYWPEQEALPAKGKEYHGLGYKRLQDKPSKAQEQQQQQPAVAQTQLRRLVVEKARCDVGRREAANIPYRNCAGALVIEFYLLTWSMVFKNMEKAYNRLKAHCVMAKKRKGSAKQKKAQQRNQKATARLCVMAKKKRKGSDKHKKDPGKLTKGRWKLTKGQVKHASGLNNARRNTERWLAPIKPHLQHLAAASSAGTSLEANLKHITVTLATWDAVWEVYLDPKWARQRLRLYGAQDRALKQFFKKLEEDTAEVSMECHGHAKQLVVFFGAASIGTGGGWGADAVLRACCKVVCRPRGAGQRGGRVVLVDEHRTTRVSSAVNGKQPCEVELNTLSPTQQPGSHTASSLRARPSTPLPAKRNKRTKAEPAAEPTQTIEGKGKGKGKAAKAKPAPQPGRWLDRDCNAALNMQRIGESRWRPLELCYWPEQGALPAKGKEYPGLGYKRLQDKPPKAQEQQQPAVAHRLLVRLCHLLGRKQLSRLGMSGEDDRHG
ncbi:hypothetical protein QJQ45_029792 [Haematococcus lacustris]|nr:hypothetical protein QJQ45_029792 [Haematococcus lacustris]